MKDSAPVSAVGSFWIAPYSSTYIRPVWDNAQRHQTGPCSAGLRQAVEVRERREQQHPGADLDQGDQMRRCAGQTLDDQRRYRVEQRRAQCQRNPQQILAHRPHPARHGR